MRNIHVVLASDQYYFPYIYVAIKTLYENNKEISNIYVHYIEQNVPDKDIEQLRLLSKQFQRDIDIIRFYMPKEFDDILPAYGLASKTTYAKFWFASMFPNEDRVLYLDPDVLVMREIETLYNIDFEENLIAGVIENLPVYHMHASNMTEDEAYINGGMVLCNLDAWRRVNFEKIALERLKDVTHNLNYDQGILNEICAGKIKVLPPKYNALAEVFEFQNANKIKKRYGFKHYYSQKEIEEAVNFPVIIHFTGFLYGKPLSQKCTHPYTKYFQDCLKNSQLDYKLTDADISLKQKVRKFFLHHMPFHIYLMLEKCLDVRRKKKL